MHPHLLRELRRHGIDGVPETMQPILQSVSALLDEVDRERELSAVARQELSRELELRFERMQQSEQRDRLLFAESPMAMFAVTRDDRCIIAWNRAAETTFGHTEQDALRQPLESLNLSGNEACWLSLMLAPNVPLPGAGVPIEALAITDSILATEAVRVSQTLRQLTIAPLIAEAMHRISEERSVSSLFD